MFIVWSKIFRTLPILFPYKLNECFIWAQQIYDISKMNLHSNRLNIYFDIKKIFHWCENSRVSSCDWSNSTTCIHGDEYGDSPESLISSSIYHRFNLVKPVTASRIFSREIQLLCARREKRTCEKRRVYIRKTARDINSMRRISTDFGYISYAEIHQDPYVFVP